MSLADEWQEAYDEQEASEYPGEEEPPDVATAYRKALTVLFRVRLRINPLPSSPTRREDDRFLAALNDMMDRCKHDNEGWKAMAEKAVAEGGLLLKREWERLKKPAYSQMLDTFRGR